MAEPPDRRRPEPPDGDETDETRLLPGHDAWPEDEEPTVVQPRRRAASPPPHRRYERIEEEPEPRRREPVPPPPPPRRALWPWLLLLLAIVFAGIAAAYWFTRETEPERIPVPAVVRLPEQTARERLQRDGFQVDVERAAADMPVGIVFAQTPGSGRTLPEGATVIIHVSEGPDTTAVPNVVGLQEAQARERLRQNELEAAPENVFSEEPPGTVVAQEPTQGGEVERGSPVRIAVSQGSGRVEVPDVVGLLVQEATSALEEQDLEANLVGVPSREPEGTVVAQNPAGGNEATRGDAVRLNVSRGP
jgi:eukaryotic-like serine/threonine-protein kinase